VEKVCISLFTFLFYLGVVKPKGQRKIYANKV